MTLRHLLWRLDGRIGRRSWWSAIDVASELLG